MTWQLASFCALAAASLFETERSQAKHGWKQGCWTDMETKEKRAGLMVRVKLGL
jgi:gamma-glutamylcysteine synthetase